MVDVRKILIIFVIGALYAIFVQSLTEAVYPSPDYEDYCDINARAAFPPGTKGCSPITHPQCEAGGRVDYIYDSSGCPTSAQCNYCDLDLRNAREFYNLIVFIASSIFGLLAIAIGLYIPSKAKDINEWIATGFMLGGLITLFVGTARYYGDMARILRPVVILAELILIIYIAYKKWKK